MVKVKFLIGAAGVLFARAAFCAAPRSAALIAWVPLPGGTFTMESDNGSAHRVTVKPFEIAKTLVTNRQYQACVAAGACTPPNPYCGGPAFNGPDQPVVCVDFSQARRFSKWVGGRLPTEAEWEYAARGAGKKRLYPWGDEPATCARAATWDCANATVSVCSRPAGNTEQGLCDMAGNAWEWVEDWFHHTYDGAPGDGSAWTSPPTPYRVIRGGSWYDDQGKARVNHREPYVPKLQNYDELGFRPVRPPLP